MAGPDVEEIVVHVLRSMLGAAGTASTVIACIAATGVPPVGRSAITRLHTPNLCHCRLQLHLLVGTPEGP
jgi:hypothetical protein